MMYLINALLFLLVVGEKFTSAIVASDGIAFNDRGVDWIEVRKCGATSSLDITVNGIEYAEYLTLNMNELYNITGLRPGHQYLFGSKNTEQFTSCTLPYQPSKVYAIGTSYNSIVVSIVDPVFSVEGNIQYGFVFDGLVAATQASSLYESFNIQPNTKVEVCGFISKPSCASEEVKSANVCTTAYTEPLIPSNLRCTTINERTIQITYDTSSDTVYNLYENNFKVESSIDEPHQEINLIPGTNYSYHLIAVGATSNLTSNASDVVKVCTRPLPPGDVVVIEETYESISVKLSWPKIGEASFFMLEISQDSQSYNITPPVFEHTFSGLNSASLYGISAYSVLTCDGALQGELISQKFLIVEASAPLVPTIASLTTVSNSILQLDIDTTNFGKTFFVIKCIINDHLKTTTIESSFTDLYQFKNLEAGTHYTVQCQASYRGIHGNFSEAVEQCTEPNVPNDLVSPFATETSVNFTFNPPLSSGFSGYCFKSSKNSQCQYSNDTEYEITGLTSGESVAASVQAIYQCPNGVTKFSETATLTAVSAPAAPVIVVEHHQISTTKLDLTCTTSELGVTYMWYKDGILFETGTTDKIAATGLVPCTPYNFTCQIIKENRISALSAGVVMAPYPEPPQNVMIRSVEDIVIQICFLLPDRGLYDGFEGFPSSLPSVLFNNTAGGMCMNFSVAAGTPYELQIASKCGSVNSQLVSAPVTTARPSVPTLSASTLSTSAIQLTSSLIATSYKFTQNGIINIRSSSLVEFENLAPGTVYEYTLSIVQDGVESEASSSIFACTNPSTVSSLTEVCDSDSSTLKVMWSYPLAGNLDYYDIEMVGVEETSLANTQNSYTFQNLQPNTEYTVKIRGKLNGTNLTAPCEGAWSTINLITELPTLNFSLQPESSNRISLQLLTLIPNIQCIIKRTGEQITSSFSDIYVDEGNHLLPGKQYTYVFLCKRNDGCIIEVGREKQCTLPEPPAEINQISASEAEVEFNVVQPTTNIDGYSYSLYGAIADEAIAPIIILSNQQSSTKYYYCIFSYILCEGVRLNSSEICVDLYTAPEKPSVEVCALDTKSFQVTPTITSSNPDISFYVNVNNVTIGSYSVGDVVIHNNLIPGHNYRVDARASYFGWVGDKSDEVTICTLPSPPTGVEVVSDLNSLTLKWSPPSDGSATTFEVKEGSNNWIDVNGLLYQYTFNNLASGTSYTLQVRSKIAGCSSCTDGNAEAVSTPVPYTQCTRPIAPIISDISANSPTSLTIRWRTDVDNCDTVYIERNGLEIGSASGVFNFIDDNVIPGSNNTYALKCEICITKVSTYSIEIFECATPLPPSECSVLAYSSNSILTKWIFPTIGEASGFLATIDEDESSEYDTSVNISHVFSGVAPTTEHNVCVQTYITCSGSLTGTNPKSECRKCSGFVGPEMPVLSLLPIDNKTIQLSILDANDAAEYEIYRNGGKLELQALSKNDFPYLDSTLNCGTQYGYFVSSEKANFRQYSVVAESCSAPDIPVKVTAESLSSSSLKLHWERPKCGDWTGFFVQVDSSTPIKIGTKRESEYTFNQLDSATQFSLRINSYLICSPIAQEINSTFIDVITFTKPVPPIIDSSSPKNQTAVDILFHSSDQGVTFNLFQNGELLISDVTSIHIVRGLPASTEQNFSMTAVKNGLTSDMSNISTVCTKPYIPVNVETSPISTSVVNIRWMPPAIGTATYYIVKDGGGVENEVHDSLDFNVTGLPSPATCYNLKIQSVYTCPTTNVNYSSEFTEGATQCTRPSTPTFTSHTAISSSQISLTFSSVDPIGIIAFALIRGSSDATIVVSPHEDSGISGGTRVCYYLHTIANEITSDVAEPYCVCTKPAQPLVYSGSTDPTVLDVVVEMVDNTDYMIITKDGTSTNISTNSYSMQTMDTLPATCYQRSLTAISYISCNESVAGIILLESDPVIINRPMCTAPVAPTLEAVVDISASSFKITYAMDGQRESFVLELTPEVEGNLTANANQLEITVEGLTGSSYQWRLYAVANGVKSAAITGTYSFPDDSFPTSIIVVASIVVLAAVLIVTAVILVVVVKIITANGAVANAAAAASGPLWTDPGANAQTKINKTYQVRTKHNYEQIGKDSVNALANQAE